MSAVTFFGLLVLLIVAVHFHFELFNGLGGHVPYVYLSPPSGVNSNRVVYESLVYVTESNLPGCSLTSLIVLPGPVEIRTRQGLPH
jgi:hypothetical protein